MDPQAQFCHDPDGPARGQRGRGNVRIHSRGTTLSLNRL